MRGLTAWDLVSIVAVLLISTGVGVYYAIQSKKRKGDNTSEFMSGGRRMPLIPTSLSLMASFISGVGLLSIPAEIYTSGVVFVWCALGACVGILFCTVFVVPVLFGIKSISMYAYVQDRFQSKALRLYSSSMFQLSCLMYMAVVLYAPAVALAAISGWPTWIWILSVGVVCTVYTSIGGLKAVVWTDTFQSIIIYAGLLTLLIKGTMVMGGFGSVFHTAKEGGRLANVFDTNPDPQYLTIWTAFTGGGLFHWISVYGTSQVAMQRYRSLPSVGRAQLMAVINIPGLLVIMVFIYYLGVVMFSFYSNCDPLKANYVTSKDQLVIKYTLDVLGDIRGLPGLFLAGVFSATLSTISSGINSLSAAALEDYVRLWIKPDIDERTATRFSKLVGIFYGFISVALAFAAEPLGGILMALSKVSGSLNGPNVGLILAGILFPWANKIGGVAGVIAATVLNLWIFVGSQIEKQPPISLPTSTAGCPTNSSSHTSIEMSSYSSLSGLSKMYNISFLMYGCLGTSASMLVCLIVSALTGGSDAKKRCPELLFWSRQVDDGDRGDHSHEPGKQRYSNRAKKIRPSDLSDIDKFNHDTGSDVVTRV